MPAEESGLGESTLIDERFVNLGLNADGDGSNDNLYRSVDVTETTCKYLLRPITIAP